MLNDIFREARSEAEFNVHVQPDLGFLHLGGITPGLPGAWPDVSMHRQYVYFALLNACALSTFLAATFLSLIAGHITTACHRYAHKLGEFGVEEDGPLQRFEIFRRSNSCFDVAHRTTTNDDCATFCAQALWMCTARRYPSPCPCCHLSDVAWAWAHECGAHVQHLRSEAGPSW